MADAAGRGTSYGAATAAEVELAEEVAARVPSVEMLRMTSSGTEAAMGAIRLARAVTGREIVIKFAGAYHGHSDGLLADAGSGLATLAIPASPGVTDAQAAGTVVVPWNDREAVSRALEGPLGRGPDRGADCRQHGRRPARRRVPRVPPSRHPRRRRACSSSTR